MRYEGAVYRPPSEAQSLIIQATIGCPHNKCAFCGMYKDKKFRIRLLKDIFFDLDAALEFYGPDVQRLFLADGNTIAMKTKSLVKILLKANANFPDLKRVTVYGSARFLNLKSSDEFITLKNAGLTRIHLGLESGDEETLARMVKGASRAECIESGKKVVAAGIDLSVYYLLGLGGRERLYEHASESASAINEISPSFVRIRTLSPGSGTPLGEDFKAGLFELPSPKEAMEELRILIQALSGPTLLLSDHMANYLNLTGELPRDKPEILATIDDALKRDDTFFTRNISFL